MKMYKDETYPVEVIEAYLSGAMNASERDKFEAQLATDENLQEQVKLHQLTIAALQHHGQREDETFGEAMESMTSDELKALLQRERDARPTTPTLEDEDPGKAPATVVAKKQDPRHRRSAWWHVLAAAALVTGVWFGARSFYMHKMAHRTDQKITDTYIAMRESSEKASDAVGGDNEVFMQRHKELTDTLDIAQVAPTPDSIEVVMQQAMFAMRNDMTDEAISLLEPLYLQSGMNKEVGIALAMAYVKAKQRDKAVSTLNAMNKRLDGDPEIEELMKILTD